MSPTQSFSNDIETGAPGADRSVDILRRAPLARGAAPDVGGGPPSLRFNTAFRTKKVKNSLRTLGGYTADGSPAPDLHGSISPSKGGADVVAPCLSWIETHYLPASSVTSDWRLVLESLKGHTNCARFHRFPPGQVLFLGAKIVDDSATPVGVAFEFQALPDETNPADFSQLGIPQDASLD